jgi:hypothetical protein
MVGRVGAEAVSLLGQPQTTACATGATRKLTDATGRFFLCAGKPMHDTAAETSTKKHCTKPTVT